MRYQETIDREFNVRCDLAPVELEWLDSAPESETRLIRHRSTGKMFKTAYCASQHGPAEKVFQAVIDHFLPGADIYCRGNLSREASFLGRR